MGAAAALILILTASACKVPGLGGGKTPTGQVVATWNGKEVTVRDLDAEIGDYKTTDPKTRKAVEQSALNQILARKIVAQAAIDQGLDKTPDFAIQKQRAIEKFLAQRMQAKIAADVPKPTREEAVAFVAANPNIFADRKIFILDQIRMARPKDPAVLKSLEPLKTMDEVEAELTRDHIPFQQGAGTLDAVGADPKLIDQIMKLPPGEIFIVPDKAGLLANQIKDTRTSPFTGDPATDYALNLLTRQREQDAVNREIHAIIGKASGSVKVNKDYAPTRPQEPRRRRKQVSPCLRPPGSA